MSDRPQVDNIYPDIYVRSPALPAGTIMDEHVYVAMRDGIRLCIDIYKPKMAGRYPVLLSLSPYSKDIQQQPPHWSHAIESGATGFYVAHGYVHVIAQGQWIAYHAAMAAWPGPVEGKEPPMNKRRDRDRSCRRIGRYI